VAEDLYGKLGINPVAVQYGARSGILDPAKRPSSDELTVLHHQLSAFYREFKDRVRKGRNLLETELEPMAGGRVWTGTEAKERGLVDEIGGYRDALRKACELSGNSIAQEPVMITPPSIRQAPGERTGDLTELAVTAKEILQTMRDGRVWAISPFEISDD
jgi:protease-4